MAGLFLAAMIASRSPEAWAADLDSPNWRTRHRAATALVSRDDATRVIEGLARAGSAEAAARARWILTARPTWDEFVMHWIVARDRSEVSGKLERFPGSKNYIYVVSPDHVGQGGDPPGSVQVYLRTVHGSICVYNGPSEDPEQIKAAMRRFK